jgi:hypothetical protein
MSTLLPCPDIGRCKSESGFYSQYPPEALTCLAFENSRRPTTTARGAPSSRLATPALSERMYQQSSCLAWCIVIFVGISGDMGQRLASRALSVPSLGYAADHRSVHSTSEDGVLVGRRRTARERLRYTLRNQNNGLSIGGGKDKRVTPPALRFTELLLLGPCTAKRSLRPACLIAR